MSLADADPLPVLIAAVATSPDVAAAVGVDVAALPDHVTDLNTPPYPHIRMIDPPGTDGALRHLIAPLVQVEVHGDPDGHHEKPLLRRILYTVLEILATYPDRPQASPVITAVTSTGGGGYVPEPTGQPRYLATVQAHTHP